MKRDGIYRFSLQFPADTEEQIAAGELLEKLGNKKSTVIVDALREYIKQHPELSLRTGKIQIKISSEYVKADIERMIKQLVEEKLSGLSLLQTSTEVPAAPTSQVIENDIAQMLENLDFFQ